VTSIASCAFEACIRLASIAIPDSVTSIGYSAFSNCIGLTNLSIGAGVSTINDQAFYGCRSLTDVTIPASVTSICRYVFSGCSSLSTINVDPANTVYASADGVLFSKDFTTLVQYPGGKTGTYVIPADVTNIAYYAFSGCTSLSAITVDLSNAAFASIDGVLFSKDYTILVQYPGGKYGAYAVPENVTNIGSFAFYDCINLTNVTISAGVNSVGDSAFEGCSGLSGVYFKGNAPSLGWDVFFGDYNATVYFLPGATGWESPFGGCLALLLPYTYEVLGDAVVITAYVGTNAVEIIPSSIEGLPVTVIGEGAFEGYGGLSSVQIGTGVTSIGDWAFHSCTGLSSVTIPGNVTNIGEFAFSQCTGMTNLVVGAGVTTIGHCAFNFSGLTSVAIPASVTSIGYLAFAGCASLSAVNVDPANAVFASIDGVLFSKDFSTLVQYPGGKVGTYIIPDTVAKIGSYAFFDCANLTNVTIPAGITSIGGRAFEGCSGLLGCYFKGNAPSLDGYAFNGDSIATVYYLPGSTGWGTSFDVRPIVCWNPTVQKDTSFGFTENRFVFNITGTANIPVVVEATTNLSGGTWTPLTNATLGTSGALYFSDPSSSCHPSRFYRIVWP